MRFNFVLAAIMAMLSFALADSTLTQYVEATTTVTLTLTNYNATTTMYYATGTGGSPYTSATTYSKPTLSSAPVATPSQYTPSGAASGQQASLALAGLVGLAVAAFAL